MVKFKASDYCDYNKKYDYDKYKYLYSLMTELFELLQINSDDYEDETCFRFNGLNVFIDKKFGNYCEVTGSGWLDINQRIEIHEQKIKELKKNIIQLKLF